jgi:hypothetical protein
MGISNWPKWPLLTSPLTLVSAESAAPNRWRKIVRQMPTSEGGHEFISNAYEYHFEFFSERTQRFEQSTFVTEFDHDLLTHFAILILSCLKDGSATSNKLLQDLLGAIRLAAAAEFPSLNGREIILQHDLHSISFVHELGESREDAGRAAAFMQRVAKLLDNLPELVSKKDDL